MEQPHLQSLTLSLRTLLLLLSQCLRQRETTELLVLQLLLGTHSNEFQEFHSCFVLTRCCWTHLKNDVPGNSLPGFIQSSHLKVQTAIKSTPLPSVLLWFHLKRSLSWSLSSLIQLPSSSTICHFLTVVYYLIAEKSSRPRKQVKQR